MFLCSADVFLPPLPAHAVPHWHRKSETSQRPWSLVKGSTAVRTDSCWQDELLCGNKRAWLESYHLGWQQSRRAAGPGECWGLLCSWYRQRCRTSEADRGSFCFKRRYELLDLIKRNPTAMNFEIQCNTNLYVVTAPLLNITSHRSLTFIRPQQECGFYSNVVTEWTQRSNIVLQPANWEHTHNRLFLSKPKEQATGGMSIFQHKGFSTRKRKKKHVQFSAKENKMNSLICLI